MNVMDFIAEPWLMLTLGLLVALWFGKKQWYYYTNNKSKLSVLNDFFQEDQKAYSTYRKDEVAQINMVKGDEHDQLNSLIKEINLYVQKSIGTADFNIIQNKTERCVESMYEHATGELSFPTYYGLMGTFTGTFLGLIGFLVSGSDLSDENKVTNLIIGVLVSMATSLFGLYLTTMSNHIAAETKKLLDKQKNEFLDFVQLELIPKLQTTITTLQQTMEGFVPKFDVVINNFEQTFTRVIGNFRETFDQCTANFGTEFRQNSSLISQTVSTLKQSIEKITSNVENQRLLLKELRSEKMFDTLQDFVDAAKTFESSTTSINDYNMILSNLSMVSQHVIEKQTEFANSLQTPKELVERLTSLLDRISNFEHNINALGENISQAEMLGNHEMALIKRHLESLEEKKQLADRFLDTSNEELGEVFKLQTKTVKALFDNYQQQLEEEREELSAMVRETLLIINKKKADLLNHLEHAFDVSKVHTMFSHLKTLPDIVAKLDEMESMIVSGEQVKGHIDNLIAGLQEMKEEIQVRTSAQIQAVRDVSSAQIRAIQDVSSDQIQTLSKESDKLHSAMQDIDDRQKDIYDGIIKEIKGTAKITKTDISSLHDAVSSDLDGIRTDIRNHSSNMDQHLQKVQSELKSDISQVAEGTKHLRRDISKEVSTNVAGEVSKINAKLKEYGVSSEALIRTTGEHTLAALKQLSDSERAEFASVVNSVNDRNKKLQEIVEALKQFNKEVDG